MATSVIIEIKSLTLLVANPQNGQTHSSNLLAFADELF